MSTRTLSVFAALLLVASPAAAQLRIVSYNVSDDTGSFLAAGPRSGTDNVLLAIGAQSLGGVARPVDVLTIIESGGSASTAQAFVTRLNALYPGAGYAHGNLDGGTTGAGTQSIIYRSSTVQLVNETAVGTTTGTAGAARQTLRYQLRPGGTGSGYTASADFYLYSSHYKANGGSAPDADNAARRSAEALAIRQNADLLGAGARAIFAGDFNLYGPDEVTTGGVPSGYRRLLAAGNAQATDPVFSGSGANGWDGNAFRAIHSQSPATTSAYGGQVLGGMNDRFDFALPTTALVGGRGVSLLAGTYRVFGNTGDHNLNGAINTGSGVNFQATLPGYTLTQSDAVRTNLSQIGDHLPVVSDYQIPARLAATVVVTNPRVIRGATAAVALSVSNTAPAAAVGADKLDYSYAGTGQVQGSGSATGLAVGGTTGHALTVPTAATGVYNTGTVTVTATSPQAGSTYATQGVTVTALDPSRGSFDNAAQVTTQTVQFGNVPVGQASTRQLGVYNLVTTAGFTADLRYRNLMEATAGGPLTAMLAPTSPDLPAGSGNWTLTLTANSAATGTFNDTFTLTLSDENIPGAMDQMLTVAVQVTFVPVPEPGAVAFLLAAAGAVGYARRRVGRG